MKRFKIKHDNIMTSFPITAILSFTYYYLLFDDDRTDPAVTDFYSIIMINRIVIKLMIFSLQLLSFSPCFR